MTIPLNNISQLEAEAASKLERARTLEKRITEAIGLHITEFQTDGVEVGSDGLRLVFYKDDADLLEIVFYAVDDRRHIVFQRALRRTYRTITESFLVYDDDDALVEAVLPALRHMVGTLSKLGMQRAADLVGLSPGTPLRRTHPKRGRDDGESVITPSLTPPQRAP